MDEALQKMLEENVGRKAILVGGAMHCCNPNNGVFLFEGLKQERGRAKFSFVYPKDSPVEGEGVMLPYAVVIDDDFESARVRRDLAHGGEELLVFAGRCARVNTVAGVLYKAKEIAKFYDAVRKYNPRAPFLSSNPVTLLREGVHIG